LIDLLVLSYGCVLSLESVSLFTLSRENVNHMPKIKFFFSLNIHGKYPFFDQMSFKFLNACMIFTSYFP